MRGWDDARLKEEHWRPHHDWAGREFYAMAVDLRGFYLKVATHRPAHKHSVVLYSLLFRGSPFLCTAGFNDVHTLVTVCVAACSWVNSLRRALSLCRSPSAGDCLCCTTRWAWLSSLPVVWQPEQRLQSHFICTERPLR